MTDIYEKFFQFRRYVIVGAVNTLFGYAVYALFILFGLTYQTSCLLSTLFGASFNFITFGRLVFCKTSLLNVIPFIVIYLILYMANVTGIGWLVGIGYGEYVSALLMLFPITLISYAANKYIAFKI